METRSPGKASIWKSLRGTGRSIKDGFSVLNLLPRLVRRLKSTTLYRDLRNKHGFIPATGDIPLLHSGYWLC